MRVFECCNFLNDSFYELANPNVFKYQAQKLSIVLCVFFLCLLIRNDVCAQLYVRPIQAGFRVAADL